MTKTKQRRILFGLAFCVLIIALCWLILTLWVEKTGPSKFWHLANKPSSKKVLIIFDPDPIYNLDEKLCLSLATGFAEKSLDVTIITVAAIDKVNPNAFDGYTLCANTYNWAPDWAITGLIESANFIKGKPVIAITLGSGSTEQSQKRFETIIQKHGGLIIHSSSKWLMRPNDEKRMQEENIDVVKDITYNLGLQLADSIIVH